jgi:cytochrome c-type biogenesis protein CcmH
MNGFLVAVAVTILVVLLVLMRPYFRRLAPSVTSAASHKDLNSAIYREQFAKLEQDLAEGMIAQADYAQARAELQRRLLEEVQAEDTPVTVRPPRKTMIGIGLALPIVAGAFYLWIGNPGSLSATAGHQLADAKELDRMVAALAQKLEKEPSNYQGWVMLARSYKAMGRNVEAERAFEKAGSFIDDDAQMLANYADVVAGNNGGSLAGKPTQLIQKALKADPDNPMALWLSGTADMEAGKFAQALQTWERLYAMLPPGSDDARMLQSAIDDVRAKSGIVAKLSPALAARAAAPAGQGGKLSGTVELDPALKGKAAPGDTVMIMAHLPGTRMPLAVMRTRASELPLKFVLDDSLSMNPQSPLSAATEVEVEVRISKTGMAKPESGDLISQPQKVKVGTSGIALRVAQVRP